MNIIKNDSELFITGQIGFDFSAENFIQQINSFDKDEVINVHIYSGGGSLFDALAIYDFVKLKGIKFNTYISGLSGSAATIIGACSENAEIGVNSMYFLHRSISNNENLKQLADERLVAIYKELTGLSESKINKLLDAGDKGQFLSSQEAVNLGFVNSVFKENSLAAEFHNEYVNQKQINMTNEKIEEMVNKVVASVTNFFKEKEKEVSNDALENSVKKEVANAVSIFETEKEVLNNKISELENEIAGLKVVPTEVKNVVIDPNPTDDKEVELTAGQKAMKEVFANITPEQKLMYTKKK